MKHILTILFLLVRLVTFGQESKLAEIDKLVSAIDTDSVLTLKEFTVDNRILKIWTTTEHQILKIVEKRNVNYGEIKSTIYLKNRIPIKTIESESVFVWLTDSIARIKGYSIDLVEEYSAVSYVLDWSKKQRKLIITGKPTEENTISLELKNQEAIIRKSEKLIRE